MKLLAVAGAALLVACGASDVSTSCFSPDGEFVAFHTIQVPVKAVLASNLFGHDLVPDPDATSRTHLDAAASQLVPDDLLVIRGWGPVRFEWPSSKELVVRYPAGTAIGESVSEAQGISITYVPVDDPRQYPYCVPPFEVSE